MSMMRQEIHDPQGGISPAAMQRCWDRCHAIERGLLEAEGELKQRALIASEDEIARRREWKAIGREQGRQRGQVRLLLIWTIALIVGTFALFTAPSPHATRQAEQAAYGTAK